MTTASQTRRSQLRAIVRHIEQNAPEPATREVRRNRYEGEVLFSIRIVNYDLDCVRRVAYTDTSDLDYHNGTGYSSATVYDEIAVLNAWDVATAEEDDAIVCELNEMLC